MAKNKKKRGLPTIKLSRRAKIILAGVITAVVVLGAVTVVLVVLSQQTKPEDSAPLTAEQKRQAAIKEAEVRDSIAVQAQSAMERGDSEKVAAIYDAEIKKTTDVNKKTQLLIDESRTFLYGGKTDKAIQAAKTAESLSSDKYLAADWLAQVYYSAKQYDLSAQYYTLAGTAVGSPNNTGRFTKEYYDQKAATMAALVKGKS